MLVKAEINSRLGMFVTFVSFMFSVQFSVCYFHTTCVAWDAQSCPHLSPFDLAVHHKTRNGVG